MLIFSDSDTGNQASWQSVSPQPANPNFESKEAPQGASITSNRHEIPTDGVSGLGDGVSAGGVAPIAMSDPTVSIDGGSFDEDTSAADYFTYDEGRRTNQKKKQDRVIRRPRLSPPCKSFVHLFVIIIIQSKGRLHSGRIFVSHRITAVVGW